MNIFFILASALLTQSCLHDSKTQNMFDQIILKVSSSTYPPHEEYADDLKSIRDEFIQDAASRGVIIAPYRIQELRVMKYVSQPESDSLSSPLGPEVMATCRTFYIEKTPISSQITWRTIEIVQELIDNYAQGSLAKKKEVIYHELFHCLLGKGHLPRGYSGIMSPIFNPNDQRAVTQWEALVDELFSPLYMDLTGHDS